MIIDHEYLDRLVEKLEEVTCELATGTIRDEGVAVRLFEGGDAYRLLVSAIRELKTDR